MLKIENFEVVGWEHAIRGMRNPMNSWDKSDSFFWVTDSIDPVEWNIAETVKSDMFSVYVGGKDHRLMMNLAKGGPVHAKYRRMIAVYLDVTAPLYWWKEFDTYKVGTVRNSCSTMHKIHVEPFTFDNFAHDAIDNVYIARTAFEYIVSTLEELRMLFNQTQLKEYWRAMIQLLPDGFLMKATLMLNYEVLVGIYRDRKNHKLDEWHVFCDWISELPYSEIIIGARDDVEERD